MMPPRRRVYVADPLFAPLTSELQIRDLVPLAVANQVADLASVIEDPSCRAAVIDFDALADDHTQQQLFSHILRTVAGRAIDLGVRMIFAVDPGSAHQAYADTAITAAFPTARNENTYLYRPNLAVWSGAEASSLAQTCFDHNPGPPWKDIPVNGPGANELSDEDRLLLQRAFSDCTWIDVEVLRTRGFGLRRTCVIKVRPHRAGAAELVPFIVKTGAPSAMDREEGNTRWACGEHTPFPYFPPLAPDRHVSSRHRRTLISHFVERAVLFEHYLTHAAPSRAVTSLFDGPLRCWRSHTESRPLTVGAWALSVRLVRDDPAVYATAHALARQQNHQVRAPADLLAALTALPPRHAVFCGSHGDLHSGNIFVRENSTDIVLIDFNRAGEAPASRDPAELEVSLAFGQAAAGTPLPSRERLPLYRAPLLTGRMLTGSAHPRAQAIEQIRAQVVRVVPENEYAAMVAAHCLFYAAKGDGEAYLAADGLLL